MTRKMSETREFPTAVIASLSTGIALCNFSDMQDAAEYLMGHPIWTHHLASKELWEDIQKAVLGQHPKMPTKLDGVTEDNYLARVAELEASLGKYVTIHRGDGATALSPLDGIPDHLKDNTILISV